MAETAKCSVCGRNFSPNRGLLGDVLQETTGLPSLLGKAVCPECKRAASAGSQSGNQGRGASLLGSLMAGPTDAEVAQNMENQRIRQKTKDERSELASLNISGSADEIQSLLNNLVSRAAGLKLGAFGEDEDKQTMKVIKEKIEFGIMKLKGMGNIAEAEYFQNKIDTLTQGTLGKIGKLFGKKA